MRKSPCCHAPIRRFGGRRRQCQACRRTWTARPRQRGRPPRRARPALLTQVFGHGYTLRQLATRRRGLSLSAFRARFRQELQRAVTAAPSPPLPSGPLVLLADGLWFQFADRPWGLYLTAVKSCHGAVAVFLDPVLLPGRESTLGWGQVFAAMPPAIRRRIRAVVADHLPGMRGLALQYGWVLQLCHFHLLLKLQVHPRRHHYALKGGWVRDAIAHHVRAALEAPTGPALTQALAALRRLRRADCGTARIQATVRGFVRHVAHYRAYLDYPTLGLPRTTNAVESMGRLVREMLRRSRAGSTPSALYRWTTAFLRTRPQITCNGHTINRIL